MAPENIDWNSIDSTFVEDDVYENINAPQWVDLAAPAHLVDDEAWFCNPHCKHPKNTEDFLKTTCNSKVKLLRSVKSLSEILPFRDRNRRDVKQKAREINSFSARNLLGGKDILNQITEFCTELKRWAARKPLKKGSSEKFSGGVLDELKERIRDRERMPLLVVKEGEV